MWHTTRDQGKTLLAIFCPTCDRAPCPSCGKPEPTGRRTDCAECGTLMAAHVPTPEGQAK